MQTIPLAYIVLEDLKLFTGPAIRSAGRLSVKPEIRINAVQKLKTGAERGKVLAVDIEGMNRGKFNASLMEFAKVPGNELWLVEPVYDDIDVPEGHLRCIGQLRTAARLRTREMRRKGPSGSFEDAVRDRLP